MQLKKDWANLLKQPDFKNGFAANGKFYRLYDHLSLDRYIAFMKLEVEVGLSVSFKENFDRFAQIFALANKPTPEPGRIAVLANDGMLGLENLDKKYIPALYICALFLITEDEDLTVYDPDLMERKIEDWRKEGFDVQSFLVFALSCIEGFSETYSKNSQVSSKEANPELSTQL